MSDCEFYIDYLDMTISLSAEEVAVFDAYLKGEIGWTTFYRRAKEILVDKGVPYGYLRSVMMRIVYLWERGLYTKVTPVPEEIVEEEIEEEVEEIVEEEEVSVKEEVVVEFEWHARVKYCERSGHHVDVEVEVTGWFTCEREYFESERDEIRDRLAWYLWEGFVDFMDEEYIPILHVSGIETEEGFSEFYVREIRVISGEFRPTGKIDSVILRRASYCGGDYRRVTYFEDVAEAYFEDKFNLFLEMLERGEV